MLTIITVILTFIGTKIAEHLWEVIKTVEVTPVVKKINKEHQQKPSNNGPQQQETISLTGIRRHKTGGYSAVDCFMDTTRGDIIHISNRTTR